jgi:hypothetical protein
MQDKYNQEVEARVNAECEATRGMRQNRVLTSQNVRLWGGAIELLLTHHTPKLQSDLITLPHPYRRNACKAPCRRASQGAKS